MATYSERIRELRVLHGMSQQDLADRLDVNKVTISQYERGVRKPDLNVLTALCDIFNVSSDYLLEKDDMTIRIVGKEGLERLVSARTKRIPVLGRVAAGVPIDAIEDVLEDMGFEPRENLINKGLRAPLVAFWLHDAKRAPEGFLPPGLY